MERLLDGLTEDQRHAVTVDASMLRIVAGAGSGKTRVLTRRIAHQGQASSLDPDHTLALTFTRKAAGELRSRLRQLGLRDSVAGGTFHAQAYSQLRSSWADRGVRAPELLDRRSRVLSKVVPSSFERTDHLAVANEIDWATARRVRPDDYVEAADRAGRRPTVAAPRVAELYQSFIEEKRRRRVVDFDDLLELAIRDLADPAYAQTRHWRYRHLFVDEFQDVNPLQFDLLRAWLGPKSTLCVVGDPNQAIYAWNGADSRFLDSFEQYFPTAETIRLRDNFRSTPQILAAAAAIGGDAGRLVAHRRDGPLPTVAGFDDERAEADAVARAIRDRHTPATSWAHQAVLVRTNAQTGPIAEALARVGIPFRVRAGAGLLDDQGVQRRLDEIERSRVSLRVALKDLQLDVAESADASTDEGGLAEPDAATGRGGEAEALDALSRLAEDQLALDPEASGPAFVGWVRATLGDDDRGERDGVDIVTLHAAKGLEWPIVHIAGLEAGLIPIARATTPVAIAEERRLLYVGLTRANDELHCTWARTRRFGNRTMERQPSPLLGEMAMAATAPDTAPSKATSLDVIRALRADLGVQVEAGVDIDLAEHELRDRLLRWRAQAARAANVSSFVVCSDRTVDVIVERRPTTLSELADIPGLGPVKIARHGPAIVALVRADQRAEELKH